MTKDKTFTRILYQNGNLFGLCTFTVVKYSFCNATKLQACMIEDSILAPLLARDYDYSPRARILYVVNFTTTQ